MAGNCVHSAVCLPVSLPPCPTPHTGLLDPFLELLKTRDLSEICDGVLSYVCGESPLDDGRKALLEKVLQRNAFVYMENPECLYTYLSSLINSMCIDSPGCIHVYCVTFTRNLFSGDRCSGGD